LGQRTASSTAKAKSERTTGARTPAKRTGGARAHSEPLYVQVVSTLKDEILKGVHPVGTQLPSEDLLADRFSVSRHTIREALRRLRDDGLISSRQGAPTTVVRPAAGSGAYVHEIGSINDLFSFVSALQFQIDSVEMVTANAALAARLGASAGEKWLRIEGFRFPADDKTAACWMEVFVHEDYAGVARLLDHNKGPIFELIETLYGERITEVEQTLCTSPMPERAAATLHTEPGETAIEVIRTFRITSGKTAEVSIAHYPAESFTFSMTLRRTR
jgi:GntR family transcriptional regulator